MIKRKRGGWLLFNRLWVHRLEQFDLNCRPILAAHWKTPDSTTRLFVLWAFGLFVRPFILTPTHFNTGRKVWKFTRRGLERVKINYGA